ncbi:MAG: hypothetical protein RL065_335 [Bacteroidota bacterium]|jgi:hypothetical protein
MIAFKKKSVRIINAFVEKLDLQQLQFQVAVFNINCRSVYESKTIFTSSSVNPTTFVSIKHLTV